MTQKIDRITEVVKAVFERQFDSVRLDSTRVEEDVDHDGDPILRIEFIFEIESESDRLDPVKVKGLIRHLRSDLLELAENRFPVISYKTVAEHSSAAA